jgi:hypothetical protein
VDASERWYRLSLVRGEHGGGGEKQQQGAQSEAAFLLAVATGSERGCGVGALRATAQYLILGRGASRQPRAVGAIQIVPGRQQLNRVVLRADLAIALGLEANRRYRRHLRTGRVLC